MLADGRGQQLLIGGLGCYEKSVTILYLNDSRVHFVHEEPQKAIDEIQQESTQVGEKIRRLKVFQVLYTLRSTN